MQRHVFQLSACIGAPHRIASHRIASHRTASQADRIRTPHRTREQRQSGMVCH
jgi:starvation-inducible outer membrane lipoprotein